VVYDVIIYARHLLHLTIRDIDAMANKKSIKKEIKARKSKISKQQKKIKKLKKSL